MSPLSWVRLFEFRCYETRFLPRGAGGQHGHQPAISPAITLRNRHAGQHNEHLPKIANSDHALLAAIAPDGA